jgi:hypothetical protein
MFKTFVSRISNLPPYRIRITHNAVPKVHLLCGLTSLHFIVIQCGVDARGTREGGRVCVMTDAHPLNRFLKRRGRTQEYRVLRA